LRQFDELRMICEGDAKPIPIPAEKVAEEEA